VGEKNQLETQIQKMRINMSKTLLSVLAFALAAECAFAVDGVVLINQSTVNAAGGTYTITSPGSYKLSGNLQAKDQNTDVIVIASSNVTIDLNGFAILGTADCSMGFPNSQTNNQNFNNITIRNGTIQGIGSVAIVLAGASILVEYMHIRSNGGGGIEIGANFVQGNDIVQHNNVDRNNGDGIHVDGGTVADNVVTYSGNLGIVLTTGIVAGNTSLNNNYGLDLGFYAGYRGNVINFNTTIAVSGGKNLGQNLCDGVVCP
jgi:hypothetical protein